MKFLFKLILIGGVLLGAAWFYGRTLPREHVVSSTIILVAPADTVWRLVRSLGAVPEWHDGVTASVRVIGRPRETWDQTMVRSGTVRFEVRSETPGRRLITEILNDEQDNFGGTWTYDVVASGAGTEITITEEGWVGPPLYRVFLKLRGPYGNIESYLRSLGAHYGEVATPRRG